MEAAHRRGARSLRRRCAPALPAWLLGLVPLLLIVAAIGAFAALGGPGLGDRPGPGRGARGRAHGAAPGRDRADRPQRRARRGDDRAGHRQRRLRRRSPARDGADRPPAQPRRSRIALPVDRGRGLRGRRCSPRPAATVTHEIAAAVETPERRPRLLRADGAARPLRRRHPGRARACSGCRGCAASTPRWMRVLLALTVGLLGFLADRRDARGLELAGAGRAGVRRRRRSSALGRGDRLPRAGARVARTRVACAHARSDADAAGAMPARRLAALLVALGIGLHNLGEGLAIGIGLRDRRARARRVPRRRLRAAQHDRGPGDRRAARRSRGRALGRPPRGARA